MSPLTAMAWASEYSLQVLTGMSNFIKSINQYSILAVISILDLRKMGGARQPRCKFPLSYTGLYNVRWPEEGDALQTGDASVTARISDLVSIQHSFHSHFRQLQHDLIEKTEQCKKDIKLVQTKLNDTEERLKG